MILLIILASFIFSLPPPAYASFDLVKPNSKLYFLQAWGESLKLLLTFSKEQKIDYLLQLTEKRVGEMNVNPSLTISSRYEEHFQQLEQLANQVQNKQQVSEKIKDASLRQQEVLAKVYNQVPEQAKLAIINAQENSSKNVAQTIEKVEGSQKAQEYSRQVAEIQQTERMGQIEQVPLEGSPHGDPSQFTPKELRGINQPNQLNPINPGSQNQGGGGGGQMQPAQPIQMNQPSGQN